MAQPPDFTNAPGAVSLAVVDPKYGPIRVDIAYNWLPLAAEQDPMRLGDVVLWRPEHTPRSKQQALDLLADGLEVAVAALRGAS